MFTLLHLGHDHATQPHTAQDYVFMGLAALSAIALIFAACAIKKAISAKRSAKQHA